MRCAEVRENLVAFLDGELSPEERERVESHLAGCRTCPRELAVLETTGDLLGLLGDREKSDLDIAGRVLAQTAEGDPWCRHIRRELVAFVDGALAEEDARPVSDHLAECEECAREATLLDRTFDALSAWKVPAFDVDLLDRLPVARPRRAILRRLVPAAAAACVLAAAGVLALRSGQSPVTRSPDAIDPETLSLLEEDPDLIDLAEDLDWLEDVSEEELALLNGWGG